MKTPQETARSAGNPRVLFALVILAMLIRGLYWLEIRDLPLYQNPTGDAATHLSQAQGLLEDGFLSPRGEPYHQAPLYPAFLAAIQTAGLGLDAARWIQMILGVVGVGLLWVLGGRLAGSRGAWIAGLGGALYGPFVFFENELLSISIAVFLLELALVLWGRRRAAVLVGLALGMAALAQPNLFLAGLLIAATVLVAPTAWGWTGRSAAWLLLVGLVLPPAGTLARNLAETGEPVLISTNGGINFYIGNNDDADGTFHLPPGSGLLNRPEGLFTSAREVAVEETGGALSDVAVDRFWWLRGLDFWITSPVKAVGVTTRKILLSLNNYEIPNHYDYEYFRNRSSVLRFLPTMGWLLPLGGLGLILGWRRGWKPGAVFFLAVLISVVPFFITARYRLPLAIFLWPGFALAVDRVLALRAEPRRWGWLAGAAVLYAVVAFAPLVQGGDTRAHMLNLEGSALFRSGDLAGARRAFEGAVEAQPNHAEALNNLGRVLARQGETQSALSHYRRALAADPTQAETYLNLEEMYRAAGRNKEALEIMQRLEDARLGRLGDVAPMIAYRRGINRMALRDTTGALGELETAVETDPALFGAWLNLATLRRVLGDFEGALVASEQAVGIAPDVQQVQASYGVNLEAAGRKQEAALAFNRALEIGPPSAELHFRLGRLLLSSAYLEEAERHLLAANEGSPHADALWALGQYYEHTGRAPEAAAVYEALTKLESPLALSARARLQGLRLEPDGSR